MMMFELSCPEDIEKLNRITGSRGILFDTDLFGSPYATVDMALFSSVQEVTARPRKISEELKAKAIEMKKGGATVRQIAKTLNLSIGSVSSITRK